jgi:hypothetical protein
MAAADAEHREGIEIDEGVRLIAQGIGLLFDEHGRVESGEEAPPGAQTRREAARQPPELLRKNRREFA